MKPLLFDIFPVKVSKIASSGSSRLFTAFMYESKLSESSPPATQCPLTPLYLIGIKGVKHLVEHAPREIQATSTSTSGVQLAESGVDTLVDRTTRVNLEGIQA